MSVGLVNLFMLFGLGAAAIPVIIHLLNRQRYQVVDWGAMQFLQISQTRRRKLFLEELLLMLLRIGLIALLVLALTAPFAAGPLVSHFASRPNRDVVLILDGSASMGLDDGKNVTPHEAAKNWAKRFLGELSPGDTISVVLARQQPAALFGQPTHDLTFASETIARLPPPRGGGNGPRAVELALDLLRQHGQHAEQDIILVTDGQRAGWFNANSIAQWKKVARSLLSTKDSANTPPRLWLVSVTDTSKAGQSFSNFYWSPLRSVYSQVWRYQPAPFETTLMVKGPPPFTAPQQIELLVDGKFVSKLPLPEDYPWSSGQVPLHFRHKFTTTGSHLLSVVVHPDPPAAKWPPGYVLKDFLPADNRCDLAVMVRERLHVLLVDGDDKLSPESSTAALRKAFSTALGAGHPSAVVAAAIPQKTLTPAMLTAQANGGKPRVLVLSDVPSLDDKQREAVEQFLADGGSVLVAVGERITDPASFNLDLFRDGKGWLPARLDKVAGSRDDVAKAATVDMSELQAPLALFREKAKSTLDQARFPQWWKLSRPAKSDAAVLALLNTGDPLLVEKNVGKGRVLLCAVPLDRSWGSTFPAVLEYPVLLHEWIYYLANTKAADYNLAPGQPLRFAPDDLPERGEVLSLPLTVELERPDQHVEKISVKSWPLVVDRTEEPGVYSLRLPDGRSVYYVVEGDRQESELTLASEEEHQALRDELPLRFEADPHQIGLAVIGADHREDIWWILLLGVVALLCLEIALTRRMVAKRVG